MRLVNLHEANHLSGRPGEAADHVKRLLSVSEGGSGNDNHRAVLAGQLLDSLDPDSEVLRRRFAQARRRALRRLRKGIDL